MPDSNIVPTDEVAALRKVAPPDEKFYQLDEQELAFFKSQTGIEDDEKLKQHIVKVQRDAFEVHPYPCISRFAFTKLKISRLPAYDQLLKLGKEREGAIFLDIGCCFGNDVRKAVADGFPVQNAIASDIEPAFWQLGHQLFDSTPETFPVPFIPGDAFDASFLRETPPFYAPPETSVPDLSSLTTLTPLLGHVSAIHASSFFHLFDEAQQLLLAKLLAGLLSPIPGSVLLGSHSAWPEKGSRTAPGLPRALFCHGPDSWKALWDGEVFGKGSVKVDVALQEVPRELLNVADGFRFYNLLWSVTRL